MNCKIINRKTLPGIYSASGITLLHNHLYIIGDNVPKVYELDKQFNITSQIPLNDFLQTNDILIAKADKPDFEALEMVDLGIGKELMILGSGSKSPQRDVLVRINILKKEVIKTYSLQKFYDRIRLTKALEGCPLNIEAIAIDGDDFFLFNRGKNLVFQYTLKAFVAYLEKHGEYTEPKVFEMKLPEINGIEAGLTGATSIPGQGKIIFTATVENTPNPIDDGEVMGSFIGLINLREPSAKPLCVAVLENNVVLRIKIESIALGKHINPNEFEVYMVTDSDGGESEILKAHFTST